MTDDTDTHEPESKDSSTASDGDAGFVEETVDAVRESSRKRRIEVLVAFLMALATIGAAWASYESSR